MATTGQIKRLIKCLEGVLGVLRNCHTPIGDAACQRELRLHLAPVLASVRDNEAGTGAATKAKHARQVTALCVALCEELSKDRHALDDAWVELATAVAYLATHCQAHKLVLPRQFIPPGGGKLVAVVKRLCAAPATISQQPWGVAYFAMLLSRFSYQCSGATSAHVELTDEQWRGLAQVACAATPVVTRRFLGPASSPGTAVAQQRQQQLNSDGFGPSCTCVVQRDDACCALLPPLVLFGAAVSTPTSADDQWVAVYCMCHLCSTVFKRAMPMSSIPGSPPCSDAAARVVVANLAQHGVQQLSLMAVALAVHGARQAQQLPAVEAAGRVDLARFLDPSLLAAITPTLHEVYIKHVCTWVADALCPLEVCPSVFRGGLCAGCLPDQLLLLLEAAALVKGSASELYQHITGIWARLEGRAPRAALAEFWRRAPAPIAARVLQALRDEARAPPGSAAAMDATAVGNMLVVGATSASRRHDDTACESLGSLASVDMLIEASARAPSVDSGTSSMLLLDSRMLYVGTAPLSRWQGAWAACAPAGAIVSTGKFLMRGGFLAPQPQQGGDSALRASTVSEVERAYSVLAMVAGRVGSLPDSAGREAAALTLLFAARVGGAAAVWLQREAQRSAVVGRDSVRFLDDMAVRLQQPPLVDALRDAGVDPPVVPCAPSMAHSCHEPAAESVDDSAAEADAGGSQDDGGSSVDAAALEPLQFLAQLHDQLDATALGVRLPGCYNPRCADLSGAGEAYLSVRMCSGCRVGRYCSVACSKQHWRWHKAACKRLSAAEQSAG